MGASKGGVYHIRSGGSVLLAKDYTSIALVRRQHPFGVALWHYYPVLDFHAL